MTDYAKSLDPVTGQENQTKSSLQVIKYRVGGRDITVPVLDSIADGPWSVVLDSAVSSDRKHTVYGVGVDASPLTLYVASGGTADNPLVTPPSPATAVGGFLAEAWIGTTPFVAACGQLFFTLEAVSGANNDEPTTRFDIVTTYPGPVSIISSSATYGTWINNGLLINDALVDDPSSARSAATIFEVRSTAKGAKPFPKMTTAQRVAMTPVAGDAGLIVEDTDINQPFRWSGTIWEELFPPFTRTFCYGEIDVGIGLTAVDAVRQGTNAYNTTGQFRTNRRTAGSVQFTLPPTYCPGNDVSVDIWWHQDSLTVAGQQITWGLSFSWLSPTEAPIPAPTNVTSTTDIPNSTTVQVKTTLIMDGTSFSPGDKLSVQLFRDGTDTYTDDALWAALTFTVVRG